MPWGKLTYNRMGNMLIRTEELENISAALEKWVWRKRNEMKSRDSRNFRIM